MNFMKSFKQIAFTTVVLSMLTACGGTPGKVKVSLVFDSTVTQADKDSIEHFIFIVNDQGSTPRTQLYPDGCLGGTATNQCIVNSTCGFGKSETVLDPRLDFDDFPEGQNLSIQVCALGAGNAAVAEGSTSIANTDGATGSMTLMPIMACTGLPANCQ